MAENKEIKNQEETKTVAKKAPVKKDKYKALIDFRDAEDDNKLYQVGEQYPKPSNKKVSQKRLNELAGSENKLGKAVIEKVGQ